MSKVMLIDAAHAEETRVAVVDGTQVEEFDFESRAKKQLRGNIYLAKVTRVEPSLQAAFVEYGGNRHGFLAFNEIHPDYYQIPLADREVLLREEAEDNERHRGGNGNGGSRDHAEIGEDGEEIHDLDDDDDDDVMDEEIERRRRRLLRRYKIQEVIKRRQIMLVQVVKDERGAKGASLTTYLSLAGRYGVLMPNTARGGGISRKIATTSDRKRLKEVVNGLDLPQGMGLIVRTAGAKRTKPEIKRDYEYLMRLWENIRDVTLKSIAPALIYEEEDLVKRAIRDMYDKDVDAIFVEGDAGYKEARDFMRMIVPSQAKKVQHYNEATPLFVKHRIEDGLAQIYSPVVPLRSGGYLVINQTEALVAIDVNSGKSTRERNIESTALKTNLEAAEEAARQLRLRDLAGLIVIDFIDMDESKNNRAVEKKLSDALKADRARIQMGKISSFGLMELSRQRRKTGVLEATTHVCSHCQGVGRVRAVESSALSALRAVEIEAGKNGGGEVILKLPRDAALYILNEKRQHLARLQHAHGLLVTVQIDDSIGNAEHEVERTSNTPQPLTGDVFSAPARLEPEVDDFVADEEEDEDEAVVDSDEAEDSRATSGEDSRGRDRDSDREGGRGRRRRRRGGRGERPEPRDGDAAESPDVAAEAGASPAGEGDDRTPRGEDESEGEARRRRGRRGRRGSRRGREGEVAADGFSWTRARTPDGADPYGWYDTAPPVDVNAPTPEAANNSSDPAPSAAKAPPGAVAPRAAPKSARSGRSAAKTAAPAATAETEIWVELPAEPEKPTRGRARRAARGRDKVETAANEAANAAPPAEALSSPVAVEIPQPEVGTEPGPSAEAAPAAKPKRAPRRTKAQVAAEAETALTPAPADPEPELQPVVPASPAEPDPAEIMAPPAKPKRGWWRR